MKMTDIVSGPADAKRTNRSSQATVKVPIRGSSSATRSGAARREQAHELWRNVGIRRIFGLRCSVSAAQKTRTAPIPTQLPRAKQLPEYRSL